MNLSAGKTKTPLPAGVGCSNAGCRSHRRHRAQKELNDVTAPGQGCGDIVRFMAHGDVTTIGLRSAQVLTALDGPLAGPLGSAGCFTLPALPMYIDYPCFCQPPSVSPHRNCPSDPS